MRTEWLILWGLLGPLVAATMAEEKPFIPDLLIVRDGWNTPIHNVKAVLNATAAEFWSQTPDLEIPPIIVYPKGGPIVYFQRGPDREFTVHLDTGETFWAQYAYQFSHELCHILCQYDRDPHGQKWFEESLCELASIDTLRRMGKSWKSSDLPQHLKDFAPHLTTYAADLVKKGTLDDGETLSRWYQVHQKELLESATNRPLNTVVAVQLLPLFEEKPLRWRAVRYLNAATPTGLQTFEEYLRDWRGHCPDDSREVVDEIARKFGITLSIPPKAE